MTKSPLHVVLVRSISLSNIKLKTFESFENQGLSAFLPFRQSSGGNLQLIASSLRYRQRAEPAEPTSVIFRFISDMSS
jgi:hypothetical protein